MRKTILFLIAIIAIIVPFKVLASNFEITEFYYHTDKTSGGIIGGPMFMQDMLMDWEFNTYVSASIHYTGAETDNKLLCIFTLNRDFCKNPISKLLIAKTFYNTSKPLGSINLTRDDFEGIITGYYAPGTRFFWLVAEGGTCDYFLDYFKTCNGEPIASYDYIKTYYKHEGDDMDLAAAMDEFIFQMKENIIAVIKNNIGTLAIIFISVLSIYFIFSLIRKSIKK